MTTLKPYATKESVIKFLPQHPTFAKQRNCLLCGRPRSSRAQHMLQDSTSQHLVCSRRSCTKTKSLLRMASSASVVVEIHHYYHDNHLASETQATTYVSELHAEPTQQSWAELPCERFTSQLTSEGHRTLPTIFEETPSINASSKPNADAVRAALDRRGW
ncbi:hypothetical protein CC86DRAFT_387208 [Ophiobolus disseminans]|uniref:Uncharacterized protein n=1 Tax=Ophiobolus disseminans TaxID=1469910 RepID=A0A6A6ZKJ9_9PLEO|nr:hypothetical protein CC86DRAFT_387208 [Ophiobolus disseminans]